MKFTPIKNMFDRGTVIRSLLFTVLLATACSRSGQPGVHSEKGVAKSVDLAPTTATQIKGVKGMAEIIKTYRQEVPALRFIGKKYGDSDRVDGGFGKCWSDWFANGWFAVIEKQSAQKMKEIYEDGDAYIGLMRCKDGEPFEYWIGIFMPENTPVPAGFESRDFAKSALGTCWLYGQEGQLYGQESRCGEKLVREGYKIRTDGQGAYWFFERYCCPRFTTPDEKGNKILDICHYIK